MYFEFIYSYFAVGIGATLLSIPAITCNSNNELIKFIKFINVILWIAFITLSLIVIMA